MQQENSGYPVSVEETPRAGCTAPTGDQQGKNQKGRQKTEETL
jgi:hypothetical protein